MKLKLFFITTIIIILFLITTIIIILFLKNYYHQTSLAEAAFEKHMNSRERTCPTTYYVNTMPGVYDDSTLQDTTGSFVQNYITAVQRKVTEGLWANYLKEKSPEIFREGGYFIVNDNLKAYPNAYHRKELFDMDLEWISKNCNVITSRVS